MAGKIFILAFAVLIWQHRIEPFHILQANSQQCGAPVYKTPLRPPLAEESPFSPNLRTPFAPESALSTEASSLKCNNPVPWNIPTKVSPLLNQSPSLPIPSMSAFTSSASETLSSPLGKPYSLYDKSFLQSSPNLDLDCARPSTSSFRKDTVQDSKLSQFPKRLPSSVRRNVTSLLPCNVPCADTDRDLGLSMPTFTSLSTASSSQNYIEKPRTNPALETSRPFMNSYGPQFDSSLLSIKPILREVSNPTSTASTFLNINSFSFSSEPQITCNNPIPAEVPEPIFSVFEPPTLPIRPSPILKPSLPSCKTPFSALGNFSPPIELLPSSMTLNESPYLPTIPKSNFNTEYGSANSMVLNYAAESNFDPTNGLGVSLPIRPSIIATSSAAVSGANTNKNPFHPTNSMPFSTIISSPITNFGSTFWEEKNNLCYSLPHSIGSDIDVCIEPCNSYPLGAPWNQNRVEASCDDIPDVINIFNIYPTKEFSLNTFRALRNLSSPSSYFPDTLVNIEPSVIRPNTPCESSNNFFYPSRYAAPPPEAPVTYTTDSFDSNSCGGFGNYITPINIGPLREITPTSRSLKEVLSSLPGHVGITGIINNSFQPCGETPKPTVSTSVSVVSSNSSPSTLPSVEPTTPFSTFGPVSSEISQSTARLSAIAESNDVLSANLINELPQFSSSAFSSSSSISTPFTSNIFSSPGLTESSASPTQFSLSLAEASGSITSDLGQTNSAVTLSTSSIETKQVNPMVVSPCEPTCFTDAVEIIPSSPDLEQTVSVTSSIGAGQVNPTPFGAGQVNRVLNPYPSNLNVYPELVDNNFSPTCKVQSPIVPNTQCSLSGAETSNPILPSVVQATSIASTKTTTPVVAETLVPAVISTNPLNLGSTISSTSTAVAESTTFTSTSYAASETTSSSPTIAELFKPVTYSPTLANISPTSSSVATMSPILSSCATLESINSNPTETSISTSSTSSTTIMETPSASVSTTPTPTTSTLEQCASVSSAKGTVTSTSSAAPKSSSSSATSSVVNLASCNSKLPSVSLFTPSQNMYNLEMNPVTLEVQIPSAFRSPLPSFSYTSTLPSSYGSISPSLMYELQLPPSIPAQFSCSFDSTPVFYT